jgi:iron complex transport system substrate-binding protein
MGSPRRAVPGRLLKLARVSPLVGRVMSAAVACWSAAPAAVVRLAAWAAVWVAALPAAQAASAGDRVLVDDRGRSVAFAGAAQRVVSLSPALTETVCALGACKRLVGTDRYSNWPASVVALPKLGGLDDAQIERIVALRPDLVLAATSTRAVDRLESLGLRVLALEPRTLAETRSVIERVALALGPAVDGPGVWRDLSARIDAAAARVPTKWRGRRVYFEVASEPYAAGEASFVGELLARLGLGNVVPAALGPFPRLSPEFVLRSQPDVVMASRAALADMPGRPGWPGLRALQAGASCGFAAAPYDALMRAGPRLAEAAEALVDCLVNLEQRAVR